MVRNRVAWPVVEKELDQMSHEFFINEKLFVAYQAPTDTLLIKWSGVVSSAEVRSGYATILNIIKKFKPEKWLLDLSSREEIKSSDKRWVFSEVFPTALNIVKKDIFLAVILPVNSFRGLVGELKGDELIQNDNLLVMQDFLYEEEARRWLTEISILSEQA